MRVKLKVRGSINFSGDEKLYPLQAMWAGGKIEVKNITVIQIEEIQ